MRALTILWTNAKIAIPDLPFTGPHWLAWCAPLWTIAGRLWGENMKNQPDRVTYPCSCGSQKRKWPGKPGHSPQMQVAGRMRFQSAKLMYELLVLLESSG